MSNKFQAKVAFVPILFAALFIFLQNYHRDLLYPSTTHSCEQLENSEVTCKKSYEEFSARNTWGLTSVIYAFVACTVFLVAIMVLFNLYGKLKKPVRETVPIVLLVILASATWAWSADFGSKAWIEVIQLFKLEGNQWVERIHFVTRALGAVAVSGSILLVLCCTQLLRWLEAKSSDPDLLTVYKIYTFLLSTTSLLLVAGILTSFYFYEWLESFLTLHRGVTQDVGVMLRHLNENIMVSHAVVIVVVFVPTYVAMRVKMFSIARAKMKYWQKSKKSEQKWLADLGVNFELTGIAKNIWVLALPMLTTLLTQIIQP